MQSVFWIVDTGSCICYFLRVGRTPLFISSYFKVEKESTGKNYLWKITCVGHLKLDVQTVRVVRENRVGATVKVERPKVNHKDQQVFGVCLAGVLWSDGNSSRGLDQIRSNRPNQAKRRQMTLLASWNTIDTSEHRLTNEPLNNL